MNSIGKLYTLTSFGESHGVAVGGIIDGLPSGIQFDLPAIQAQLTRRRPGQSELTTPRDEKDQLQILSGLQNGISLGSPIGFFVNNTNTKPKDYQNINTAFRPGHADFTYQNKYGISANSGGGRSSARETIARVVSGAFAAQVLALWHGIIITSRVAQIAGLTDPEAQTQAILDAKKDGDSVGGIIECTVTNMPIGLGSPVFDRLEADLAKAMLSIPATKGFSIGSGFEGTKMRGSQHNDQIEIINQQPHFLSNNAGGTLGGISSGADLVFQVAFKPTSTIQKEQKTITQKGENTTMHNIGGRHDPCVIPRALPIVDAMAAHILLDHALRAKAYQ
jgi:chorismate synthase